MKTTNQKLKRIGLILFKVVALLGLLYFFICSLDTLSSSFSLLGARVLRSFFADNELLQNPVVGLVIGVLVTVMVQSSSTSTSIVVTMVGSNIIHVRQAIPIVMGANIGTSVTNTIVSLMQSADRNEFRRAFAAATVHDCFNWLTVIVLLPIEVTTRYLETLTESLVGDNLQSESGTNPEFLNALTKPFTKLIIDIDKKLLDLVATGNITGDSVELIKKCCNATNYCKDNCRDSLFGLFNMNDITSGIILLVASLIVLCTCLILLVKVLNSVMKGPIAKLIKTYTNREYDFPYSLLVDYGALVVGAAMTILVQSSSVFTSALTPLAGVGVISIERIYPLTLGSNIGTTTTGILAALAADPNKIHDTLQLALCHLFFNISGILIFYPIPFMRWPIPMARVLGSTTANYRWFSVLYLIFMFFLFPLIVFGLSILGIVVLVSVGIPVLVAFAVIILVNVLQNYKAHWLPEWIQDWHFLPKWMRSLEPLDRVIMAVSDKLGCSRCGCCAAMEEGSKEDGDDAIEEIKVTNGIVNEGFEKEPKEAFDVPKLKSQIKLPD